jgi:hypothetical protein
MNVLSISMLFCMDVSTRSPLDEGKRLSIEAVIFLYTTQGVLVGGQLSFGVTSYIHLQD